MPDTAAVFNDLEELTTGPTARLLGCSEGLVRLLANQGALRCRKVDKLRLFNRADVLELRARRAGELPR